MFKTNLFQAAKRATATLLTAVFLASNLLIAPIAYAASLTGTADTLGAATISQTSTHALTFTTQTALIAGDTIELYFSDFTLALDAAANVTVSTGPTDAVVTYSNANKKITLTLASPFGAGAVAVDVIDGKITNPAARGQYPVSILTRDSAGLVVDSGLALADVTSEIDVSIVVTTPAVGGGGGAVAFTQTPTLNTPAADSYGSPALGVDFSLPETALAGSVTLTFTRTGGAADASSPHAFTLATDYEAAGSHSFNITVDDDWLDEAAIVAATGASDQLIDGTIYSVMLSYRDTAANPTASAINWNFTYDSTPVSSTIAIGNGAILETYSTGAGSATLNGEATTSAGQIAGVEVSLKSESSSRYWDGTAWQTWTTWLATDSRDGAFDTSAETWEYRGLGALTSGETYTLRSRASKTSGTLQTTPAEKTFTYSPAALHSAGTGSALEIEAITAGPDFLDRTSLLDGQWFNYTTAGADDQISFAWQNTEINPSNTFYYVIDENAEANSLEDTELAVTNDSTQLPYFDGVELAEGTSYFHLRTRGSSGAWGSEQVFVLNYDTTPPVLQTFTWDSPAGTYQSGDTLTFTIDFSEPVISEKGLAIYFNSGGQTTLPAWSEPISSLTGTYAIGAWDSSRELGVSLIAGTITDHAENTTANPAPRQAIEQTDIQINGARLEVLIPDSDAAGRYTTTSGLVRLRAIAEATEFKVNAAGLASSDSRNSVKLNTWLPYQTTPFDLVLAPTFGTHRISVVFRNAAGAERTANVLIAFLADETEQTHAVDLYGPYRAEILQYLESWLAAGLDPAYAELIDNNPESNLHILEALYQATKVADETATQSAIAALNATLAKLPSTKPATLTVAELVEALANSDIAVEDLFTIGELNRLLATLDTDDVEAFAALSDTATATVMQDEEDDWNIALRSVGLRDTDSDGLSDQREFDLGTNPYLADTDGDSYPDGLEVLDLGTDPLVPNTKIETRFTNLTESRIFTDPAPLLRGTAPDGMTVKIIAIDRAGSYISLGTATADTENKWLILPGITLIEGKYEFRLLRTDATVADRSDITINLDFILPPPDFYLEEEYPVFKEGQPVFHGNTYYGSTVVANFQSLLTTTSVVADNPEGDFSLQPGRDLDTGEHTLLAYAELPDGTRSTTRILKFKIDPNKVSLFAQRTSLASLLSLKNLILFLLLGNLIWLVVLADRSRRNRAATT